ncbi:MAG: tRNA (adenosine(37)-N6)-dimethylallyltransferase MiaA [Candidatus Omnitrophica bacterium]|nr:tRNA (adenosine(37)-N6)-dimethylallyltransferase MiaA [Candidatus Omnitrophota bacterium]
MPKAKAKKPLICLIGPTAVGKTEVALQLAKRIRAEIISCDSMQVYKGIDIASSKPTKRQRKEVPHHLIDVASPCRQYNAARFRTSCLKIIGDIHKRGNLPLIVAGTGLYLRALLDGLFTGPGQSAQLRRRFYQQAKKYGPAHLYKKLKEIDPPAAGAIHPHDLRRIVRALEVYELTDLPISKLKKKANGIRSKYDVRIFGLKRQRDRLYARIEKRVDEMFRQGLVAEIKKLTRRKVSRTAKSLLGYKEIEGFLNGEYSCDEARGLLKRNTRRYAKRQLSWFRKEKGVRWVEVGPRDTPELVAKKIASSKDVGDRQR